MIDLARLPIITKARSQSSHQSIVPISGLQQQSPAVGTALALIKLWATTCEKFLGTTNTCVVLSSDLKEASFVAANRSSQHVCNRGGFFCLQISSPSRIMRVSDHRRLVLSRTSHQCVGPLKSVRSQDLHFPVVVFARA